MTDRHTVDTITSDVLDQLYAENGRLAFVIGENSRRHKTTIARVNELLAGISRARDAARLHGQGLLSTAELYAVIEAVDMPGPAVTETAELEKTARVFAALHQSAEQDVSRVIALYEQWVKAGPPPLGVPLARWWDKRLVELHDALDGPGPAHTDTTTDNRADAQPDKNGPTIPNHQVNEGEPADNQTDNPLVVEPYRNDRHENAWVFRCWGTDTCDGWLSLDHTSKQSAERARDRHVAEEHRIEDQP